MTDCARGSRLGLEPANFCGINCAAALKVYCPPNFACANDELRLGVSSRFITRHFLCPPLMNCSGGLRVWRHPPSFACLCDELRQGVSSRFITRHFLCPPLMNCSGGLRVWRHPPSFACLCDELRQGVSSRFMTRRELQRRFEGLVSPANFTERK